MPRPPRVVLAVVTLTAALSGCGGSASTAAEQRQVRATLQQFAAAVGRGDVTTICSRLLDPRLVERINAVGLTCPAALRQGFGGAKRPQLTVGRVTVAGDRARAQVRATAANQPAATETLRLVKLRGSWRVTSLGAPSQRPPKTQPGVPATPGAGPSGGGD